MRTRPYQVPRMPVQVIPRPRLLNALHSSIGYGLTVVQAPAGCGKTTLLAQFAADVDFEIRWLSLDRSCQAPEVLAERLARSLTGDAQYPTPAIAGDMANLRAYVGAAVRLATDLSERPLLLILDSLQEIDGHDECNQLLNWVLSSVPEGTEVILSSRTPVEVDELDDRILAGQVSLVGVQDLVFTENEIGEIVTLLGSDADVSDVFMATAGWPVGVMAILRGALRGNASRHLEMSEAWERYIVREVWASIPEDASKLLMPLSIAPVIDAEVGACPHRAARLVATPRLAHRQRPACRAPGRRRLEAERTLPVVPVVALPAVAPGRV